MKVNVLIPGAGRSGTSSLFEMLCRHPEVAGSSVKEVHFFSVSDLYARGTNYLHSFFNARKPVWLTADTYLLCTYSAIEKVYTYNPEMKFVILLREPVSRAWSNFHYSKNFGHISGTADFLSSSSNEKNVLAKNNTAEINNQCHFFGSLYAAHLRAWQKRFPASQFFIRSTEDFYGNLHLQLPELWKFIGISPDETGKYANTKTNVAAAAKHKGLQQFLLNRNHPLRKSFRFIFRPMRSLIVKSGVVNAIGKWNKVEQQLPELNPDTFVEASNYFSSDLVELYQKHHIQFAKHEKLYRSNDN